MSMSSLKLTMASSFCTNPYKLVRHITTTRSTSQPTTTATNSSSPTQLSCSWWRLTPGAHFTPVAHVSPSPSKNQPLLFTMFRGRKTCLSSSPTRFPLNGARFSGSNQNPNSSPASGTVADMDPDNERSVRGGWYDSQTPSTSPSMQQQPQQPSSKLLTLPTILTLGRVAAVPLLISTFYVDSWWGRTATTSIFIAAAITDWLDGYIARKMSLGSTFGAFLDPVADKLMVAATLVLLCTRPLEISVFGEVPWLLPVPAIAIIGREITMSAVREWAASQNAKLLEAVAVNNLGKWKTATQMIALTLLLATRDSSLGGPWFVVGSGVILLYISAGLSLWSLTVYMAKVSKVLLK